MFAFGEGRTAQGWLFIFAFGERRTAQGFG
jgi:hypothetical protein